MNSGLKYLISFWKLRSLYREDQGTKKTHVMFGIGMRLPINLCFISVTFKMELYMSKALLIKLVLNSVSFN